MMARVMVSTTITGTGQKGDQKMSGGNAAILRHKEEGRNLRLFYGARGEVRYVGQFEVDHHNPFYRAPAPQRGSSRIRKVIIFRLLPIDSSAAPKTATKDESTDQVVEVPVESKNVEYTIVHPKAETYAVRRLEQRLVHAYRDYMKKRGSNVVRHRLRPSGEATPLFTDAYDKTRNNLIEAKGAVSREMIRMAIGQIADYGRFFEPKPHLAVLLSTRPRKDLEDLLASQSIYSVWQKEDGGFNDNADGIFT